MVIESGKRAKKKVERLDMSAGATPKEKKKLEIPEGSGDRLGDCPRSKKPRNTFLCVMYYLLIHWNIDKFLNNTCVSVVPEVGDCGILIA